MKHTKLFLSLAIFGVAASTVCSVIAFNSNSGLENIDGVFGGALLKKITRSSKLTGIDYSKTFLQAYEKSGEKTIHRLRFATAVKMTSDVDKITMAVEVDGKTSYKDVSTVYQGLMVNDKTYYYDPSDATKLSESLVDSNYYFAVYQIDIIDDLSYLNKEYKCSTSVNDGSYNEYVETSFDDASTLLEGKCVEKIYDTDGSTVLGTKVHKEHTMDSGVVTKEAGCSEDGVKTFTCSVCGEKETQPISSIGHSYGTPSYTWDGVTSCIATATCSKCQDVLVEEAVITSEVTKAPRTIAKGETTYTATFTNSLFAKQTKVAEDVENLVGLINDSCVTTNGTELGEDQVDKADGFTKATKVVNSHGSTYKLLNLNLATLDMYDYVEFAMKSDGSHWVEVPDANNGGAGAVQKDAYNVYRLQREIVEGEVLYSLNYRKSTEATFTKSGANRNNITYIKPYELDKFEIKVGASGYAVVSEIRGKLRLDNDSIVSVSPLASGATMQTTKYNVNYPLADVNAIEFNQLAFAFTNKSAIKAYYGIGKVEYTINAGTTVYGYINKLNDGFVEIKFINGNREVNSGGAYRNEANTYNIELDFNSLNTVNFRCHGDGAADINLEFTPLFGFEDSEYTSDVVLQKVVTFAGDNENYTLAIDGHDSESFSVAKGTTVNFTVTPEAGFAEVVVANGEILEGNDHEYEYEVSNTTEIQISVKEAVNEVVAAQCGIADGAYDSQTGLTYFKGYYEGNGSGYSLAPVNVNKYTNLHFDVKYDSNSGYIKFGLANAVKGGGEKTFVADTVYTVSIETTAENHVVVCIANKATGVAIGGYSALEYDLPSGMLSNLVITIYGNEGAKGIYASELLGVVNPDFKGNDLSVLAVNPKTGNDDESASTYHFFEGDKTYIDGTYGQHALAGIDLSSYGYVKFYTHDETTAICGLIFGSNTEYQYNKNETIKVELIRTGDAEWSAYIIHYTGNGVASKRKWYTGLSGNTLGSIVKVQNHSSGTGKTVLSQLYVM